MKSLVKLKAEPGIWMQDSPKPDYASNEVLIKIVNTAICGTDIHIYKWDEWAKATVPTPMIVGHEFYGEIVALGEQVQGLKLGQKVSGEGHITCGLCQNCRTGKAHFCAQTQGIGVNRTGCFAEYLAMPHKNVIALPDEMSSSQGAILDPLGNATHCALAFDLAGEDVLITGAGPIGIMACGLAKHLGARHVVITDINPYRLALALKMGATKAVNVTQQSLATIKQQLNLEGFTVGLEMSGTPAGLNDMISHLQAGANIALLGILPDETLVDWQQIIFKGLTLKGIYGREMFRTWYKMIAMLQSGLNVNPIITHHFEVKDYQQAFELMASGQSGKVILDWV